MHINSNANETLASVFGAILVLTVFLSIGLIAVGGWPWFMTFIENSAASWAQAIGSILAIFAAIYISRMQIDSDRSLESARLAGEDRKKVLVLDALLDALEQSVDLTKDHFDDYTNMPISSYYLGRIRAASDAIAKIDLFACPAPIIQPLLRLFPTPCENLLETLRLYGESFDSLEDDYRKHWPGVSNSFTVAKMLISSARDRCQTTLIH